MRALTFDEEWAYSWGWMGTRFQVAMLGVALIATAGCDECQTGQTRCLNNNVQYCGPDPEGSIDTSPHWRPANACRSLICFQPPGMGAMCVVSTDPDPLCAGATRYCDGDVAVHCSNGYSDERQQCGVSPVDPVNTRCVASSPQDAICVPPEAMPSDVCAPAGTADAASLVDVCAGNLYVICVAGLAISTQACAVCAPQCTGFLGDSCASDNQCAAGFTCHPDSTGTSRCTAACDAADPNAVQHCADLFVAGGPPPSTIITLGSRMTCTAGFCEWMTP